MKREKIVGNQKGFTLVEIAIVLVIIGLIIGAAAKGKDLLRSAEQKKIYNKFLNGWNTAYLSFYDRTGQILGDTWNATGGAAGQDGQADTANGGATDPSDAGRGALITSDATTFMELSDIGVSAPTSNLPGNAGWAYRVKDSAGGNHDMKISFDYQNDSNRMVIEEIPSELAIAIDTMIDGSASGTAGEFTKSTNEVWTGGATAETAYWKMQF